MLKTHNLGFPRMGPNRELKFALEGYWSNKYELEHLDGVVKNLQEKNWLAQKEANLSFIPVGDLPLYDHVLDTSILLGNVPSRFIGAKNRTDQTFLMGRGKAPSGTPTTACEMTKWFDTNYHYIVPEFSKKTAFNPDLNHLVELVKRAKGVHPSPKPVVTGPATYILLGKSTEEGFDHHTLATLVAEAYGSILQKLVGVCEWVQLDEPILTLDLSDTEKELVKKVYSKLSEYNSPKKLIATYFSDIGDNQKLVQSMPIDALHIDTTTTKLGMKELVENFDTDGLILSLGVVDGKNVWRSDLTKRYNELKPIYEKLGDRLWIAPSCSLLHVPYSLENETSIDPRIKDCMAFAVEKLDELKTLQKALDSTESLAISLLKDNLESVERQQRSTFIHSSTVEKRVSGISDADAKRNSAYPARAVEQRNSTHLPNFPTTTIGSFPQTADIRRVRREYKLGKLNQSDYQKRMQQEIKGTIQKQEEYALDVLVHGEPERNDMVEYFGELLDGVTTTQNGWVQSYGSRCVKPPLIYGDVSRPKPMSVDWISYAQSLTKKPVKGMLTGPVTIMKWSFVRTDQPREITCSQIALALRDEIGDLEKAGIKIIQVDEPAIREGMPLRKSEQKPYLNWATFSFRLATSGVHDATQIHTHMCYSQFGEIADAIIALDADVLTIESARSGGEAVAELAKANYPNEIGPGVYDIHSPNPADKEFIISFMEKTKKLIPVRRLWINPDCGLKTRRWEEVDAALPPMVSAAKELR